MMLQLRTKGGALLVVAICSAGLVGCGNDMGGTGGPGGGVGSGGNGGTGGTGGGGQTDGGGTCVKGQVRPDQVIIIGDSYIATPFSQVAPDVIGLARQAGSLAATATYRIYSQGGASMNH